jgi:hypothetical protein
MMNIEDDGLDLNDNDLSSLQSRSELNIYIYISKISNEK